MFKFKKLSLYNLIPDRIGVPNDHNKPDEDAPEWQLKLYELMFEGKSKAARIFDISLFLVILLNVILILLESVSSFSFEYIIIFRVIDIFFATIYLIEYILRVLCVKNKWKFILSTYGIIDLLAILPSFMTVFFSQAYMLMLIRSFRLLRVFRTFRMVKFLDESRLLILALLKSFRRITIFLFFILILSVFLGSAMFVLESDRNSAFSNIPRSIYWAIVTITTVGYGDITPITNMGKFLASFIMVLGYSIIAVPSGILSASFVSEKERSKHRHTIKMKPVVCEQCKKADHEPSAQYCNNCGSKLE